MTLYQYNILSENERTAVLWQKGVYLDARRSTNHRVNLYSLFSFYVEVFCNPASNKIERLRSFSSVNQLEPYLKSMELSDLDAGH